MTFFKPFIVAVLFVYSTTIYAGDARQKLQAFLDQTNSMQATFTQTLDDHLGIQLQTSSGTFVLKRPGRFLWDYKTPYAQKIISNGEKVWIYDSELEQVSIKKYNQVLTGAPVILLDQRKKLDIDFIVVEQGAHSGQYWLSLQPRTSEKDFKQIEIGMLDNKLKTMKLIDNFDQTTTLIFSQLEINPQLDNALFDFIPPSGTDVVGDY